MSEMMFIFTILLLLSFILVFFSDDGSLMEKIGIAGLMATAVGLVLA